MVGGSELYRIRPNAGSGAIGDESGSPIPSSTLVKIGGADRLVLPAARRNSRYGVEDDSPLLEQIRQVHEPFWKQRAPMN